MIHNGEESLRVFREKSNHPNTVLGRLFGKANHWSAFCVVIKLCTMEWRFPTFCVIAIQWDPAEWSCN